MSRDDFRDGPSLLSKVSKEHACFSRQMIQKQIRREYVNAVEEKLQRHPLALPPHYRDHMTPEVSGAEGHLDHRAEEHVLLKVKS